MGSRSKQRRRHISRKDAISIATDVLDRTLKEMGVQEVTRSNSKDIFNRCFESFFKEKPKGELWEASVKELKDVPITENLKLLFVFSIILRIPKAPKFYTPGMFKLGQ